MKFVYVLLGLTFARFCAFSQESIDLLIINKRFEKAIGEIDRLVAEKPEASLYFKKGLVLCSTQKYREAVQAFSVALKTEPENPDFLVEMADALTALGNYHDATPHLEKAVRLAPNNQLIGGKLGKNYIQLEKFQKAYILFENICAKDSSNTYWNKQFAYCAHQIGKTNQAISLYEKSIALNPRDYASYFNLITLFQQKEQFGKAMQTVNLGLESFPGDVRLFLQKANQFFRNKQYDDARKYYENYFFADGDSLYKVLLNYGISLYFSGNEQNAIKMLDLCTGQVANDPFALFYLSLCYKKQARYHEAESYMNASIESATPSFLPEMYHHLGQIYGQQRKFEESIGALKKANELDSENHEVLFEIATTYEEFNSNKTLALNYYNLYLKEAGESAKNVNYALDRMKKIKEDLFFEE